MCLYLTGLAVMGRNVAVATGKDESSGQHDNNHHQHDPRLGTGLPIDGGSHELRDPVFNCRAIIINERFWNRIRAELLDIASDSGPVILYQLGLSYGWELGNHAKSLAKEDIVGARELLQHYSLIAGWGLFEAADLEKSGIRDGLNAPVRVKVFNSFFARASKSKTGNPSCFFISGMLAGVLNGLYGGQHNCLESQCLAAGSEYCEFDVART